MMRAIFWGIGILLTVSVLYFALIYGASELGGEVVTLDRSEANGEVSPVRIWIVDQSGTSWIEHGDAESFWMTDLTESAAVVLSREGKKMSYIGTPDHDSHDLYHKLRQEKYGWADGFIALLTGGDAECSGLPVRLQLAN
jgi:hypothetical protein